MSFDARVNFDQQPSHARADADRHLRDVLQLIIARSLFNKDIFRCVLFSFNIVLLAPVKIYVAVSLFSKFGVRRRSAPSRLLARNFSSKNRRTRSRKPVALARVIAAAHALFLQLKTGSSWLILHLRRFKLLASDPANRQAG